MKQNIQAYAKQRSNYDRNHPCEFIFIFAGTVHQVDNKKKTEYNTAAEKILCIRNKPVDKKNKQKKLEKEQKKRKNNPAIN